ncbi:MAG: hypothetical protein WEC84_02405 [Candidatus Andersenbacteria bacterium]
MTIATLPQAHKVLELLAQKKVSSDQLQRLLEGGFIADLLEANGNLEREAFRKFLGLGNLYPTVTELTGVALPESSITFGDRIADGKYDWINDDITEKRFPLSLPGGPRQLAVVHFGRLVNSSQEVEQWAANNGYEVALIDDLLAVGSHPEYKELQRQFPVIALGSSAVIGGRRFVPYLYGNDSERDLYLYWYDYDWFVSCRFLLFRKS